MTHYIFDCDDVLLDWQSSFVTYLNAHGIYPPAAGPQTWDLHHWIGGSAAEARAWVQKFNASPAFHDLATAPHAYRTVWALYEAEHTLSVLTSCGDDASLRRARQVNIDMRFGPVVFSGIAVLPLGSSKFDYLYNFTRNRNPSDVVLIEDNFAHAQGAVVHGMRAYCLRMSHNRHEEARALDTGVVWIDDLRQVLEKEGI